MNKSDNKRKLDDSINCGEEDDRESNESRANKLVKYDKENGFVCKLNDCDFYLENPIFLPCCGSSICQEHESKIEKHDDSYKCPVCSKQSKLLENGFQINQGLMNLLKAGAHLNSIHKKTLDSFDELESTLKDYSIDAETVIFDYFSKIRNKVDLHREQLIDSIQKKSDQIIAKLLELENKCKANSKNLIKKDLTEIEKQMASWKNQLRLPYLKNDEIKVELAKIQDNIKMIQEDINSFKKESTLNIDVEFLPSSISEEQSLLGKLKVLNQIILSNKIGFVSQKFIGHTGDVKAIKLIENSNKLVSASGDKSIKIWELNSGKYVTLNGHEASVEHILVTQNNKLVSYSIDRVFKIWDLNSYKCLSTSRIDDELGFYSNLCLLPDNQFAFGGNNEKIRIVSFNNLTKSKTIQENSKVTFLKLTNDSLKLICGLYNGSITIRDVQTFELLKQLDGHMFYISFVEFNQKGDLLSCSYDQSIKLWNLNTGECLKTVNLNYSPVYIKPINNDYILIGSKNGYLTLYDITEGEKFKDFQFSSDSTILLPNGKLLSTSLYDHRYIFLYEFL